MAPRKTEPKAKAARPAKATKSPKGAANAARGSATGAAAKAKASAGRVARAPVAKASPGKAPLAKAPVAKAPVAKAPVAKPPAAKAPVPRPLAARPAAPKAAPKSAPARRPAFAAEAAPAAPFEDAPGFSSADRDRFERILLEERGRLLKEMGHLEDTVLNRSLRDSSGELSGYSFHMADIGTDAMEREKAFLFASAEGRALLDVNDALRRLYNGEYGMCESCGRPISVARLEVVPQARLCVRCKEKEERGRQGANPR